jgi:peptidoglycan/xylan/chitin deacetylase (PgdA/CDA1 family)
MDNALPELEKRQLPCTIFVPVGALGAAPAWIVETNYAPGEVVADQAQVRSLASKLVTLGGHTLTHPFLSRLPREAARAEVEQSRTLLSAISGQDVRTMSFPYGDHDDEVVAMCKSAGYDMVYGIVPTTVDPRQGEFLRGRVAVSPDDGDLEFFLKMSGGYRWMSLASSLKQACLSPRATLTGKGKPSRQPRPDQAPPRWSGSL